MRPIDADAYKSYIRKTYCQYCDGCFNEWRHDDCWQWYAIRTLEEMPTIEAKPVVHAHWEGDTCSHCKLPWNDDMVDNADDWGYFDPMPAYCLNCGAQMDEVVE